MEEEYYTDYPTEPIGDGNPYYQCTECVRSVPEINGRLDGHEEWCEWMIAKSKSLEDKAFLEEILSMVKIVADFPTLEECYYNSFDTKEEALAVIESTNAKERIEDSNFELANTVRQGDIRLARGLFGRLKKKIDSL